MPAVETVETAVYTVPTDAAEADGTLAWSSTTMVLVTVSAAGRTGSGLTYGPQACAAVVRDTLAGVVTGRDVFDVPAGHRAMVRAVRNQGRPGIAGYAISAVDIALWDLKARLLDLPLDRLLGAVTDAVPLYGSGGFTTYDDHQLRDQLESWVGDEGMEQVKIKIGQDRGTAEARDLARLSQARRIIGDEVRLFADANGAYGPKQAIRIAQRAAEHGLVWFEEPVSSHHLEMLAAVRASVAADVAAGEYGSDIHYFRRMCAAGAVDCLQADATRCGGVTGWLQAAVVADSFGLEISGHCAPAVHVRVAAAAPNLRHLEWFHDHVRIEQMLFDGAPHAAGGVASPVRDRPGLGLELRTEDAEAFRVA